MATTYPSKIDNNVSLPLIIDNTTPIDADSINRLRGAIVAIETELGLKPGSIYPNVRTRLDAMTDAINSLGTITISGDLGGTSSNVLVIGLQGRPLTSTAPTLGQVLSWNGVAWSPTNPFSFPAGANRSVQFNNTGSFDGASQVSISSDGYLQVGSGPFPTTGTIRTDSNFRIDSYRVGTKRTIIDGNNVPNANWLSVGVNFDSVNYVSSNSWDTVLIGSNTYSILRTINNNTTISQVSAHNASLSGDSSVSAYPNFYFSGSENRPPFSGIKPFNDGYGIILIRDVQTLPSAPPLSTHKGFYLWSDAVTHHPTIQLPNGITYDLIASNAASGDGYAVQYNNFGPFGGATNVHISSDGYLQVGKNKTGGTASQGDIRLSYKYSIYSRDKFNTNNIFNFGIIDSIAIPDGYQNNRLLIGGNTTNSSPDTVEIGSLRFNSLKTGTGSNVSGQYQFSGNFDGSGKTSYSNYLFPNTAFGAGTLTSDFYGVSSDPFNGGKGLLLIKDLDTAPSGSPAGGFYLWSDSSTHHPKVRLPTGIIYDLISPPISTLMAAGTNGEPQINSGGFVGVPGHITMGDGYITLGTTPSGIGALRLSNNNGIYFRNQNNSTNITGLLVDTSNNVVVGDSNTNISSLNAGSTAQINIGGSNIISVSSTLTNIINNLAVGFPAASAGTIRLVNAATINMLDVSGTANIALLNADNTSKVYLGTSSAFTTQASAINIYSSGTTTIGTGSTSVLQANSSSGITVSSNFAINFNASTVSNGKIRLLNNVGTIIGMRNAAGSGDVSILSANTTDGYVGSDNNKSINLTNLYLSPSTATTIFAGNTQIASFVAAGAQLGGGSSSLGSGTGVVGLTYASVKPTTNPSGGIVLYGDSADGYLKYRQTNGNIVNINGGQNFANIKVCTLEQFGALGDGITDDSAAMTAALAAIGAGAYGALVLGAKTYNLGSIGFTIPSGCLIRGQGWNSILKTTYANSFLQVADFAIDINFENFKILGNSTGVAQRGIQFGSATSGSAPQRATVHGVSIEAFAESGILVWNGVPEGAHAGVLISNCYAKNCGVQGFYFYSTYNTLSSSAATGCGTGLSIVGGNQRIIGCDFSQNVDGIHVYGGGNDAHSPIVGCTLNHNSGNAVVIDGLLNAQEFVGCAIYQSGISITASSVLVTFDGCEIAPTSITNTGGRLRFVDCVGIDDYLVGVSESGNGWTEFVNCRGKDDTVPTWISSRVQRDASFSSDANKTLTAQESIAEILIIAAGTITTSRQITNYFAASTKRKQRVINNTAYDLTYKWSAGTTVIIPYGQWVDVGSDGTNAITLASNSKLQPLRTITGAYTIVAGDNVIVVTTNSSPFTINLPASPSTGDQWTIKDGVGNSVTNNITVSGNGKNIDGSSTFIINANYAAATFIYNGTAYNVI